MVLVDLYHLTSNKHAATAGHFETYQETEVLQRWNDLVLGVITQERTRNDYAMQKLACGVLDDLIDLREVLTSQ